MKTNLYLATKIFKQIIILFTSICWTGFLWAQNTHPVKVVASIKPIQKIATEVIGGLGEVQLLIQNSDDIHGTHLKPSQIKILSQADVVFYIHTELERFLKPVIKSIGGHKWYGVPLSKMRLLPSTPAGIHEKHSDHGHSHDHGHYDWHIWLDPDNAIQIAWHVANVLSKINPENKKTYDKNARQFTKEIKQAQIEIKKQLASVRHKPFIVFHDGYQYFEHAFGLNIAATIKSEPDEPVHIKRVQQIRQAIKDQNIQCVFAEPRAHLPTLELIVKNQTVKIGQLSVIDNTLNATGYAQRLHNLKNQLLDCLADN